VTDKPPIRLTVPIRRQAPFRSRPPGIEAILVPTKPRKTIEDQWTEESTSRKPVLWGWVVLLFLMIGTIVLWHLSQLHESKERTKVLGQKTATILADNHEDEKEAIRLIDSIEAGIRNYFSHTTVEELIPLVRHSERVAPLMRKYYKDKPVFIGTVDSIKMFQPLLIDTRTNFWMVAAVLNNGHRPLVIVEVMDSGEVLVDWESLVCHQPMDWTEYARTRPAEKPLDFRVYAEPSDFHSHEFENSSEWLCVRLTAMDSTEFLFGYARLDSLEAIKLRTLIRMNGMNKTSLILRLKIPEGLKSPRGVLIEKVVSPRWIHVSPPESGP
jgi:hypothetical protein